jgi:hypothetical protein
MRPEARRRGGAGGAWARRRDERRADIIQCLLVALAITPDDLQATSARNSVRCPPPVAKRWCPGVPRAIVLPRPLQNEHVPARAAYSHVQAFHGQPWLCNHMTRCPPPAAAHVVPTFPRTAVVVRPLQRLPISAVSGV